MTPPPSIEPDEDALPDSWATGVAGDTARERSSQPPGAGPAKSPAREIIELTWPVVLGQLMASLVPLIDILMLAKLGTPTLAAVGYASQFLTLAQACLMAIGGACVAMMARAIGAHDFERARNAFSASLTLACGITFVLTFVTLVWPHELLQMLAVKPQVIELAVPYFRLTLASGPLMAFALSYEHAFRAARNTFTPMLIASVASIVKIVVNYLLIFGHAGFPELGLRGAGVATVLAQALAVALFFWASRHVEEPALRVALRGFELKRERLSEAFGIALPAVGERLVMNVALMAYFRFLGHYGVAAVAAYNVGVRILAFTWIPGLGLSVAAATLVGHALGAGDSAQARRSARESLRIGSFLAALLGALFITLRIPMAKVFTDDPAVVADLDPFIMSLGLALPFLVTHFTLAGVLRGAGDTVTPLKAAALGNWVFRVPLGYVFSELLRLPIAWIWSIMLVDHLSRASWLVWSFKFGDWYKQLGAQIHRSAPASEEVGT